MISNIINISGIVAEYIAALQNNNAIHEAVETSGVGKESPIYLNGLFMGTDEQGFKGEVLLITSAQYHMLCVAQKNQITKGTFSHTSAITITETLGSAIDNIAYAKDPKIFFEEISNIISNVISKTPSLNGFNFKSLHNSNISFFYESSDLKKLGSFNDGERDYHSIPYIEYKFCLIFHPFLFDVFLHSLNYFECNIYVILNNISRLEKYQILILDSYAIQSFRIN